MRRLPLLLLPLCLATAQEPADDGQDDDGRIPKRPVPAGVTDPDRWRWLPPARNLDGDFIDRLFVTSFLVPVFSFEESVGAGAGVGLIDADFRGQDRREAAGLFVSRTTLGQERYVAFWRRSTQHIAQDGGVFLKEGSSYGGAAGYGRNLTRRYFGRGPDSAKDDQSSYTDEVSFAEVSRSGEPLDGVHPLRASWAVRGEQRNLHRGRVPNHPDAQDLHPVAVSDADGSGSIGLRLGLSWDTRDSAANPYRGWTLGATVETRSYRDDEPPATITTIRGVWALPVPSLFHDGGAADLAAKGPEENPPTDCIAIGVVAQDARGRIPFTDLPSLGGQDTLRGFLTDRFTDRTLYHASVEWRTWAWPRGASITRKIRIERIGFAPFIDAGTVAPRPDRLDDARIHVTPGISLRLALERALVFRLDVARSSDQVGVNFDAGMAF